ncbi:MAG: MmgE/PrpD family protein, partial [Candidatus Methylomirabilales bacterium]
MVEAHTQSPTATVARFIADLGYKRIPAEVISHIKLCILDTFGCALYGFTLPWGKMVIQFVKECGEGRGALIWGDGTEVPSPNAPLANGTLVHSFELDDIHRDGVLHPGAVTLPAVDALLHHSRQVDGKDFLTAVVAGYETGCRVGLSGGASQLRRGFHPSGTTGTFAAGAAAAKMLRLDEERTLHALGIAGTQGAGLMAAQTGSMVKRMHPGRAAQSGVYAAFLAAKGFTGITGILEADYGGFCSTLCDHAEMDLITRGLGEEFVSTNVGFKLYPCCANNHTSIDALQKMRAAYPRLRAEEVEKMVVRTTRSSKLHVGWPYIPDSITTAQMNLSYCLAAALIDGEFSVDQVSQETIRRRDILEAARRIEVMEDPELDGLGDKYRYAVKLELLLRDGTCLRE